MVTPAWVQETSIDPNMSEIEKANAGAMGLGYRFEHHLRAVGTYEIDGRTYEFKGVGTRIHRQSVRRLEGFFGIAGCPPSSRTAARSAALPTRRARAATANIPTMTP
jgi:hypothetical protein